MSETTKQWATTGTPNLLKNLSSGRYYGRFTTSGKQNWVNLDTDIASVARLRIADERTKAERMRQAGADVSSGGATMKQLVMIYRKGLEDRQGIAEKTRISALGALKTELGTWVGFEKLPPSQLTKKAVMDWRDRITREGTGALPPGCKGPSAKYSGKSYSTINHSIDALRQLLDIAVERGQLVVNPLQVRGLKVKRNPRKPRLPEPAVIDAVFDEIEKTGASRPRSVQDTNFGGRSCNKDPRGCYPAGQKKASEVGSLSSDRGTPGPGCDQLIVPFAGGRVQKLRETM
jgi:hypothetical protein